MTLTNLNLPELKAKAAAKVTKDLARLAGDEQVVAAAGRIAKDAGDVADANRPARDLIGLHFAVSLRYDNVWKAMGITVGFLWRMKQGNQRIPKPTVPDPAAELLRLSTLVAESEFRKEAAEERRDTAVIGLTARGWSSTDLAELTHLTSGRIRQINSDHRNKIERASRKSA